MLCLWQPEARHDSDSREESLQGSIFVLQLLLMCMQHEGVLGLIDLKSSTLWSSTIVAHHICSLGSYRDTAEHL